MQSRKGGRHLRRFTICLPLMLALAGSALAVGVTGLAWNQSNIETLRSFDKAAVVSFVNEWSGTTGTLDAVKANEVWQFGWFDLAGNGNYNLVTVGSSGPCCVFLTIFSKDATGKISYQSFGGAGKLSSTIKDLNGDGKDELILYSYVGSADYQGTKPEPMWPRVYRLEKGKYVEASRDFPNFYDNEVLPELDKKISKARAEAALAAGGPNIPQDEWLAVLIMERDKILRVLGRNPAAGLQQAYRWMSSDDPELLSDAAVTFKDIGGHEADARAATKAYLRAFCQQNPNIVMCKNRSAH